MKLRSRDGTWTVETISLAGSGAWLRVSQYGWFAGQVRTPAELATLGVSLADLVEIQPPGRTT